MRDQLSGNTEAIAVKADKADVEKMDKVVSSSFSNVNVSLYGQFNPALLYADNGDSSKFTLSITSIPKPGSGSGLLLTH